MTYQAQVDDVVIVVVPHGENFRGTVIKALEVTNRFGRRCWFVSVKEEGALGATFSFAQRDIWDGAHSNFTGAKNVLFVEKVSRETVYHGEDGTKVYLVFERDNTDFPSTVQLQNVHRTRAGAVKRVRSIIEAAGATFVEDDEAEWVAGEKEYWIVDEALGG